MLVVRSSSLTVMNRRTLLPLVHIAVCVVVGGFWWRSSLLQSGSPHRCGFQPRCSLTVRLQWLKTLAQAVSTIPMVLKHLSLQKELVQQSSRASVVGYIAVPRLAALGLYFPGQMGMMRKLSPSMQVCCSPTVNRLLGADAQQVAASRRMLRCGLRQR